MNPKERKLEFKRRVAEMNQKKDTERVRREFQYYADEDLIHMRNDAIAMGELDFAYCLEKRRMERLGKPKK